MPKRLTPAAAIVDIFLDGTKVSVITSQSYHTEGHDRASSPELRTRLNSRSWGTTRPASAASFASRSNSVGVSGAGRPETVTLRWA